MPDPATSPARLASLDAFRGLTIAAMILVNMSGDHSHTWWPLLHQPWHGWTPTDLQQVWDWKFMWNPRMWFIKAMTRWRFLINGSFR